MNYGLMKSTVSPRPRVRPMQPQKPRGRWMYQKARPGTIVTALDGRQYEVVEDGSLRRTRG